MEMVGRGDAMGYLICNAYGLVTHRLARLGGTGEAAGEEGGLHSGGFARLHRPYSNRRWGNGLLVMGGRWGADVLNVGIIGCYVEENFEMDCDWAGAADAAGVFVAPCRFAV